MANGRLLREGPFEHLWIQPAAGDAGGALGTALFVWHQLLNKPRQAKSRDSQKGSLLGPRFSEAQIGEFLATVGAPYDMFYGIITPVALLFRARGRDLLWRKAAPERQSLWRPKNLPSDVRRYFRQY